MVNAGVHLVVLDLDHLLFIDVYFGGEGLYSALVEFVEFESVVGGGGMGEFYFVEFVVGAVVATGYLGGVDFMDGEGIMCVLEGDSDIDEEWHVFIWQCIYILI